MNTPFLLTRLRFSLLLAILALANAPAFAQPAATPVAPMPPVAAPVPPEVAVPRPSPAEIAKINSAVEKLIEQADPTATAVFDKFPAFRVVSTPNASAITPVPRISYQTRHPAFVETAQKGDIDLLFDGDSITDWWTRNGPNAFKKYFDGMKIANFAIAGDTTQGVLWGLQNGEGQGFQPKAIMLMIGTNNTAANTAPEIAEGVGAVVYEMRKDFPNAKILLLAVFPRSTPGDPVRAKIADINKIIAKLDDGKNVFYMDIGAKFLDENGVLLPNAFLGDNLHPQEIGYDIWGAAVKDTLVDLMNGKIPPAMAK